VEEIEAAYNALRSAFASGQIEIGKPFQKDGGDLRQELSAAQRRAFEAATSSPCGPDPTAGVSRDSGRRDILAAQRRALSLAGQVEGSRTPAETLPSEALPPLSNSARPSLADYLEGGITLAGQPREWVARWLLSCLVLSIWVVLTLLTPAIRFLHTGLTGTTQPPAREWDLATVDRRLYDQWLAYQAEKRRYLGQYYGRRVSAQDAQEWRPPFLLDAVEGTAGIDLPVGRTPYPTKLEAHQ